MSENKRGFWSTSWAALNFTRQLFWNAIFLGFLLILAVIVFSSGKSNVFIKDKTTLVLNLEGAVVEQYTSTPLDRAITRLSGGTPQGETRLYDILFALGTAKSDPRITQVFLRTDGLTSIGFAQARELAAAIRNVRASGKKVIAFGQNFEQKQYLIAAAADKVYLDPEGAVVLEGLARYRQYYREALQDKLGVNVHLFRVGEFKSAAEPYVLDYASEQSKESDRFWMNDLWTRFVKDVAVARKINGDDLHKKINNLAAEVNQYKGNLAEMAVAHGLVDELATLEDVENVLQDEGSYDDFYNTFTQVDLSDYLIDIGLKKLAPTNNKIAVVVAQGEIVDGEGGQSQMGGETTADTLRQVREDENVRAVVLRVDSPGGAVYASEQIRREIDLIKKSGRRVVVSMGNTAASGGYWISMNADKIVADPSTITGSIGIFGLVPDISGTLEKVGVHTDGVATTPVAGSFDITRPLSGDVKQIIQQVINSGYEKFISKVATARNIDKAKVDLSARGRVWSGAQAKERGLVDELGGLNDSIVLARKLTGLTTENSRVVLIETESTSLSNFLSGVRQGSVLDMIGQRAGVWESLSLLLPEQNKKDAEFLAKSIKQKGIAQSYAHCLCEL